MRISDWSSDVCSSDLPLCSPALGLSGPQDLMRATLLHVEWRQPANASDWQRWARLAGMDGLTVDEGPRFSSDDHALQAAVAGHGVAIGSLILARPEIEAGLLEIGRAHV